MKLIVPFLIVALLTAAGLSKAHAQVSTQLPGQAVQTQSPVMVQRAVEDFLRSQTAGMAGQSSFAVGPVDPRLAVPACGHMEVFLPTGGRLWGNSSVGVRCGAPTPWQIYVPVTVRVQGMYVAAARAIAPNQTIAQGDLVTATGDLTQLSPQVVTDLQQAVGKTLTMPLAPGQALRNDMLRVVPAILQGQTVRLVSQGPGFRVTAEGKALANAGAGQLAQVKTATGQTVSGIARPDGTVEVTF